MLPQTAAETWHRRGRNRPGECHLPYVDYYNNERIPSALNYQIPMEVAATLITRVVALTCLVLEAALGTVAGLPCLEGAFC